MTQLERFTELRGLLTEDNPRICYDDPITGSSFSLNETSPWIDLDTFESTGETVLTLMAKRQGQKWRTRLYLHPVGTMKVDLFVFNIAESPDIGEGRSYVSRGLGYLAIPDELQPLAVDSFLTVAEQTFTIQGAVL